MASGKSRYGVHPGVEGMQRWIRTLKEKSGKSLEEWETTIRKARLKGEKPISDWLKKNHGFGTNASLWLAKRVEGKGNEDSDPDAYLEAADAWVESMFAGARAGLRPLYEELLSLGKRLGRDVKACPCKTIVPLYRRHVFAQIKPSTRTRIDLGLALARTRAKGKLIDTGGLLKGDRITHRIPLARVEDIDHEVVHWLKTAYTLDA